MLNIETLSSEKRGSHPKLQAQIRHVNSAPTQQNIRPSSAGRGVQLAATPTTTTGGRQNELPLTRIRCEWKPASPATTPFSGLDPFQSVPHPLGRRVAPLLFSQDRKNTIPRASPGSGAITAPQHNRLLQYYTPFRNPFARKKLKRHFLFHLSNVNNAVLVFVTTFYFPYFVKEKGEENF